MSKEVTTVTEFEQQRYLETGLTTNDIADGYWKSVPLVECPHCHEIKQVEKWIKGDESAAGVAADRAFRRAFIPGSRDPQLLLREAVSALGEPNMRCNNCTVEWRV